MTPNAMRRIPTLLLLAVFAAASLAAQTAPKRNTTLSGFTWGADIGGSVDMTCNNQSSFDLGVNLGYRNPFIRLAGISLATNIMTRDGNRSFPLAAALRTSFTSRPTLCFWDLKIGTALNYLENDASQAGLYLSTGVGFNLAMGAAFQSHIILNYTYMGRRDYFYKDTEVPCCDLHKVSVTFGVNF